LLVQAGAQIQAVDQEGCGALHFAAFNGHGAICKELVVMGCPVDQVDQGDRTPLHFAASGGHEYVIQQLLELGADHDAEDKDAWCGLHWAADGGHDGACLELLQAGCSSICTDIKGMIPLHYAAANGHAMCSRVLMQASSKAWLLGDLDRGWTPVHYAAETGYLKVLQVLVDNGARVKVGDDQGRSPLDVARSTESRTPEVYECIKYLMHRMAEDQEETAMRMTGKRREPKIMSIQSPLKEQRVVNIQQMRRHSNELVEEVPTLDPAPKPPLKKKASESEQAIWAAMAGGANNEAKAKDKVERSDRILRASDGPPWDQREDEFWDMMSEGAHEEVEERGITLVPGHGANIRRGK